MYSTAFLYSMLLKSYILHGTKQRWTNNILFIIWPIGIIILISLYYSELNIYAQIIKKFNDSYG